MEINEQKAKTKGGIIMKKYRMLLEVLLVTTVAYLLFDFAYSVSGIYHLILRCMGGMLFLLIGMFIKDIKI